MFLSILAAALKGMFCFTGSYSNNIFPDPLSSEEEEYYIKKFDTFENGFNLTTGGEKCKMSPLSEEAKRKIGEKNHIQKLFFVYNRIKECNEELRAKMPVAAAMALRRGSGGNAGTFCLEKGYL